MDLLKPTLLSFYTITWSFLLGIDEQTIFEYGLFKTPFNSCPERYDPYERKLLF
jgi:hypothetical protein